MAGSFTPAKTGLSRVFLIEGRAAPNHEPDYKSCMRAGAPEQSFGDVTSIECPDPTAYGKYVKIGSIQAAIERATMDLVGRYAVDLQSDLLRLARNRCPSDVQIHFGACKDPSNFNTYDKVLVLEEAYHGSWSAGDLGTLESGGEAAVDETSPLSASDMYEIMPLLVKEVAGSIVTNEVLDVVACDTAACGDCADETDGCLKFYAITTAAGGSASTAADILNTKDGGSTWYADDIDSLGAAEAPSAVGCVGNYVVVVSNASASLHYALKSLVDRVGYDETWTENATGFVASAEPNDCWRARGGTILWICGDGGYVYKCTDPTVGVTAVESGNATTQNLYAIHAYSDRMILAGGDSGALIYSTDGATFSAATSSPTGIASISAVWMKDRYEWWVGLNSGHLYYTLDGAVSWTLVSDLGARCDDICFANDTIMYVASSTSTPAGQIRKSINGGYSFITLPESTASMPANDRINAVAACKENPNLVIGVGLGDNAADGIIVVGSP